MGTYTNSNSNFKILQYVGVLSQVYINLASIIFEIKAFIQTNMAISKRNLNKYNIYQDFEI